MSAAASTYLCRKQGGAHQGSWHAGFLLAPDRGCPGRRLGVASLGQSASWAACMLAGHIELVYDTGTYAKAFDAIAAAAQRWANASGSSGCPVRVFGNGGACVTTALRQVAAAVGVALQMHPAPVGQHVPTCADTYAPGPQYCTYGVRVLATCVLYVL